MKDKTTKSTIRRFVPATILWCIFAGAQCSPENQPSASKVTNSESLKGSNGIQNDQFVTHSDDPLLLIYNKRLETVLRHLRMRESIESLLGTGSELSVNGKSETYVIYKLLPLFNSEELEEKFGQFVEMVVIGYHEDGSLSSIQAMDANPVQQIGPKQSRFWEEND